MRARPILFSAAMIRALLAGAKMQTRRKMKPQPPVECSIHYMLGGESWLTAEKRTPLRHTWEAWGGPLFESRPAGYLCGVHDVKCPYGSPGDLLWVRETCFHDASEYDPLLSSEHPYYKGAGWIYRADVDHPEIPPPGGWTSAIHMPRKASRLTLRITDVRVQRLQEISEADAIAEGLAWEAEWDGQTLYKIPQPPVPKGVRIEKFKPHGLPAIKMYRVLWESINGVESWDANPWVWALTFEVIKLNVDDFLNPIHVQACRPADRAMLATPAGQSLVKAAAKAMREMP